MQGTTEEVSNDARDAESHRNWDIDPDSREVAPDTINADVCIV